MIAVIIRACPSAVAPGRSLPGFAIAPWQNATKALQAAHASIAVHQEIYLITTEDIKSKYNQGMLQRLSVLPLQLKEL